VKSSKAYSPYLISGFIHLLLLLLLGFLYINIDTRQRWHQFEWITEMEPGVVGKAFPQAEFGEDSTKPSDPTASEEVEPTTPLIENPHWENTEQQNVIIDPSTISRDNISALKDDGRVGNGESLAYSSSLIEGGADVFFIRETIPSITPLMDDSVVVEFSINRDGTVDMNSIKVISYRKAEHWYSLYEAMRSWRFGFTGAYNPRKLYQIRCNFRLK
jgi:hypothetical protein